VVCRVTAASHRAVDVLLPVPSPDRPTAAGCWFPEPWPWPGSDRGGAGSAWSPVDHRFGVGNRVMCCCGAWRVDHGSGGVPGWWAASARGWPLTRYCLLADGRVATDW